MTHANLLAPYLSSTHSVITIQPFASKQLVVSQQEGRQVLWGYKRALWSCTEHFLIERLFEQMIQYLTPRYGVYQL